jgi:cell division protein FtsI (penicillin-binding protein 3)
VSTPRPVRATASPERIALRRRMLAGSLLLTAALVVGRAVQLQGFQAEEWRQKAAEQQQTRVKLPARRGAIYDRDGVPLALTRETWSIAVAPREVRDRDQAVTRLVESLGLSRAAARRATDPRRPWVVLPGRFSAEQRRRLGELRGVHLERRLERFYPRGRVGREVLGAVSADGRAMGGIEEVLDRSLRGTDGFSVMRRDGRGRRASSVSLPVAPPADGADVYLTLDFDLQEIADAALDEAIDTTHAMGGDLLLLDPRTGEILAAVSKRQGDAGTLSAFIEPFEPGSTAKPFFVAGMLAHGRASLTDQVNGENGRWVNPETGRVHQDVHPYGLITLRDALRVSSNIGMVKMVPNVPAAEQYAVLRDFGFGTPTGVEYPVESGGRLPRPDRWSRFTAASLATGYEFSVTPIQLALAYGALANGGNLMEAHLVREVRSAAGATLDRPEPRPVRRAIPETVAAQIRGVLADVVADGTATRASLSTFAVAGKTGTARRTGPDGRYIPGAYTPNFVGYFPAQDPQLVIVVKLDRPQGDYYGGLTAAPVSRETFQAILAARSPTLDRRALIAARLPSARMPDAGGVIDSLPPSRRSGSEGTYVFREPPPAPPRAAGGAQRVAVPEVVGLPMRDAVRRLHAVGFSVRLDGGGRAVGTRPAAGTVRTRGDTLVVLGEGR